MSIDYRETAKAVLKLAVELDTRLTVPTSERIDAWATLFVGKVWPIEATAAVYAHYAKSPCAMLLPGDVIAFCARQPVWSSLDHARDWILRVGVHHPYSGAIEAYSGIQGPAIAIPESLPMGQHKQYLTDQLTAWVTPRLDELAAAIVAERFQPWWADR